MRTHHLILCAVVVGTFVCRGIAVDLDTALSEPVKKKLDAGSAVILKNHTDDTGKKVICNSAVAVVIGAGVDQVWSCLADYAKFPEFIPRMVACEKYADSGGDLGIRQELKVLWRRVSYHVLQRSDDAAHTLNFRLDKSQKNDISETEGSWVLRPYGEGKTLAVYSLALDTGIPVPRFIQTMMLNEDLPDTLLALKKRVESGGKYTK